MQMSIYYLVNLVKYLHEFDARVERVVETEEEQKVFLHGKQLGELLCIIYA